MNQRDGKGVSAVGGSNLLSVPIHKLLAEVEELKSQQEAIRQVTYIRSGEMTDFDRIQNRYDAESRAKENVGKGKTRGMWVDQYRPKKFSDLLGEDVRLPA